MTSELFFIPQINLYFISILLTFQIVISLASWNEIEPNNSTIYATWFVFSHTDDVFTNNEFSGQNIEKMYRKIQVTMNKKIFKICRKCCLSKLDIKY